MVSQVSETIKDTRLLSAAPHIQDKKVDTASQDGGRKEDIKTRSHHGLLLGPLLLYELCLCLPFLHLVAEVPKRSREGMAR